MLRTRSGQGGGSPLISVLDEPTKRVAGGGDVSVAALASRSLSRRYRRTRRRPTRRCGRQAARGRAHAVPGWAVARHLAAPPAAVSGVLAGLAEELLRCAVITFLVASATVASAGHQAPDLTPAVGLYSSPSLLDPYHFALRDALLGEHSYRKCQM